MDSKPAKKSAPRTALTFHETVFQVIDDDSNQWLRGTQIGSALGYADPGAAIAKLYERNAAEFTESMTRVIDLQTAGGVQATRVFSFRGAHLLGMLAKTERAISLRKQLSKQQQKKPLTLRLSCATVRLPVKTGRVWKPE